MPASLNFPTTPMSATHDFACAGATDVPIAITSSDSAPAAYIGERVFLRPASAHPSKPKETRGIQPIDPAPTGAKSDCCEPVSLDIAVHLFRDRNRQKSDNCDPIALDCAKKAKPVNSFIIRPICLNVQKNRQFPEYFGLPWVLPEGFPSTGAKGSARVSVRSIFLRPAPSPETEHG